MSLSRRSIAILAVTATAVLAIFLFTGPVPQDPAYHQFADRRALLGISNFWNVMSNLPFLLVGLWGVSYVFFYSDSVCLPGLELAYIVFFTGIFLTAFGSGYYHVNPANEALVWDRLPMTVGFAGLFSIILGEFVSARIGRVVLLPLLLIGIASVEYWAYTETVGRGDLRPYAIVQFLPMMLIPIILMTYRPAVGSARYFWLMLLFYVLAKLTEHFDNGIYTVIGMSGHTLKHLFAALTPAVMLYALMQRRHLLTAATDD